MTDNRPKKNRVESAVEIAHILRYEDINGQNRLFGGTLMAWIDETACICAARHCGSNVITACVDKLEFKRGAFLNDIVIVSAYLVRVGNTSMDVRVDTFLEDRKTLERELINKAYLTTVCVDADGRPTPIPYGLNVTSEEGKREWELAEKRRESVN